MAAPLTFCVKNSCANYMSLRTLRALNRHIKTISTIQVSCCRQNASYQSASSSQTNTDVIPHQGSTTKAQKISKAMKAYIEKARKHDELIQEESAEYEIGKRHLANIMGRDPETFDQNDINEAIEYLLPSGLFSKKARPILKHPEEIYPLRKAPSFGLDGRPFHYLFYTSMPNFYDIMHDIVQKLEHLKGEEDRLAGENINITDIGDKKLSLAGSEWISLDDLKTKTMDNVKEENYKRFLVLIERLTDHPLSYEEEDFIMQFRSPVNMEIKKQQILPIDVDESGRQFIDSTGKRKATHTKVRMYLNGTGKWSINGDSMLKRFPGTIPREQLMFPLQLCNKLNEVDIEAEVWAIYGFDAKPKYLTGFTTESGAIRNAVSTALCSIVDAATIDKMHIAGLLQSDIRRRERKKPGQEGARRKFTWKKR